MWRRSCEPGERYGWVGQGASGGGDAVEMGEATLCDVSLFEVVIVVDEAGLLYEATEFFLLGKVKMVFAL